MLSLSKYPVAILLAPSGTEEITLDKFPVLFPNLTIRLLLVLVPLESPLLHDIRSGIESLFTSALKSLNAFVLGYAFIVSNFKLHAGEPD